MTARVDRKIILLFAIGCFILSEMRQGVAPRHPVRGAEAFRGNRKEGKSMA